MANWEKLNKEFEDALNSMTDKKWDEFKSRIDKKRAQKQVLNLPVVVRCNKMQDENRKS